jgi:hypothetical protein
MKRKKRRINYDFKGNLNSLNSQRFFNFRLLLLSRRPLANNGFGLGAGRVSDALNCQPTTNLQKNY